jgi:ribA/ribD-fused uncharacterized protein
VPTSACALQTRVLKCSSPPTWWQQPKLWSHLKRRWTGCCFTPQSRTASITSLRSTLCTRTSSTLPLNNAYQAHKFIYTRSDDSEGMTAVRSNLARMVTEAKSAHEAKKLTHQDEYLPYVRSDWNEVKLCLMEKLLRAKHVRHEHVRKVLRRTKGLVIVENSPTDPFWGRGPDWQGQNHLGKLWMKIRDEE